MLELLCEHSDIADEMVSVKIKRKTQYEFLNMFSAILENIKKMRKVGLWNLQLPIFMLHII